MANVNVALEQGPLYGTHVIFPLAAPLGKETEIEVVPCPLTIVAPAGTVHTAPVIFVNPETV